MWVKPDPEIAAREKGVPKRTAVERKVNNALTLSEVAPNRRTKKKRK